MSLRNQTFFCLLLPIVIIYYTKLTLHDYIRAFCTRRYKEDTLEDSLQSNRIYGTTNYSRMHYREDKLCFQEH